ncbi:hypothetical protein KCU92_g3173, partial [Aureobasidium melanogenum]
MSSPIKRVAIVGATGNMGKHTIAELQKSNNHSITALTRKGSNISLSSSINVLEVSAETGWSSTWSSTWILHGIHMDWKEASTPWILELQRGDVWSSMDICQAWPK